MAQTADWTATRLPMARKTVKIADGPTDLPERNECTTVKAFRVKNRANFR